MTTVRIIVHVGRTEHGAQLCQVFEQGPKGVWYPSEGFVNDPVPRSVCQERINREYGDECVRETLNKARVDAELREKFGV